jgi:hypothetical protein
MVRRFVVLWGVAWLSMATSCVVDAGDDEDEPGPAMPTPAQQCTAIVGAECERLYGCLSSSELAVLGYPQTIGGCQAQLNMERGCNARGGCEGTEVFAPSQADSCVSQLRGATCNQVREEIAADYAPACGRVCAIE